MNSIAPGGCYPPNWPAPPRCWPPAPQPTEPDPDSLDATVDWETYTHPQMYDMVHKGLDLTGAMEVSAQWARLGEELSEIGEALGEIVARSATAWEGEAADLARQTVAALTHWATDTGTQATKVSACVTMEVDNATNARDQMPAPRFHPPIHNLPTPEILPKSLFTTGDWTGASMIVADPDGPLSNDKAQHQQAARVMERFQESSREVYGTVPRFSPPLPGSTISGPAETPPGQPPAQPPTTTPQGGPVGGPAVPAPGPGPSGGQATLGSTGTPDRPGVPTAGPTGPGPGSAERETTQNKPAAASAGQGRPGQPGIGGMPMGGMGGAGRAEDTERKAAEYLKEEDDIWNAGGEATSAPVIGDRRRA